MPCTLPWTRQTWNMFACMNLDTNRSCPFRFHEDIFLFFNSPEHSQKKKKKKGSTSEGNEGNEGAGHMISVSIVLLFCSYTMDFTLDETDVKHRCIHECWCQWVLPPLAVTRFSFRFFRVVQALSKHCPSCFFSSPWVSPSVQYTA